MALTITQSQPMGMPSKMLGDIDIQKYGIRSVSMLAEATWAPRILISHFNNRDFSYSITREFMEDLKNKQLNKKNMTIEDKIHDIVWEHIRKECIVQIRKEKLEKLDSLKVIDIQL